MTTGPFNRREAKQPTYPPQTLAYHTLQLAVERLVGERVSRAGGRDFYSRLPSAVEKSGRSHSCRLCLVSLQERAVLGGKLVSLRLGGEDTGKIGGGVGKEVEDDFTLQLVLDGLS